MNPVIKDDIDRILADENVDFTRFRGKSVLITGPYGMLASYLVFALIRLNERDDGHSEESDPYVMIYAAGRSEEKCRARFGRYMDRPYFHFIKTDLTEPLSIDGPVDFIIHAASHASPDWYSKDPVGIIRTNTRSTEYLLDLAAEKKSESFLFFSSGEIYGKTKASVISEKRGGFLDPAEVRSCYGESKRLGETLCVSYAYQYGVPARIVRPSHTYGPTMDLEHDTRVFAAFVSDAVHGRDIAMTSDGTASRCFIYLADAALAYFKVLLDGETGEAYNVTNPEGVCEIYDLACLITSLVPEKELKVTRKEPDPAYMDRGKAAYRRLDTAKLEALGFRCRYDLKEGFRRTIKAFL